LPLCTICKFQVIDISLSVCPNCGAPLQAAENADDPAEDTSPEICNSSSKETADDGASKQASLRTPDNPEDDLEICDPGELLYAAETEVSPSPGEIAAKPPDPTRSPVSNDEIKTGTANSEVVPESRNEIRKLSPEQVDSIRSNMLNGNSDSEYVSAEDASSFFHDLSRAKTRPDLDRQDPVPPDVNEERVSVPSPVAPVRLTEEVSQSRPMTVAKSAPARRVAYFHKNFIQLTGSVYPHTGDELIIDDRHYILKPKRIKKQYTIGAFALLLAIVFFFIGKQFISPTLPGSGSIIGVVVDESGQPIYTGVEVALPEAGKRVVSDPTGFFRFDNVPTGVYAIRSKRPEGIIAADNISVAANEITTLVLGENARESRNAIPYGSTEEQPSGATDSRSPQSQTSSPTGKSSQETTAKTGTEYASLKLKANVENAKVSIDGEILGSGNMTFKKLRPGSRTVTVAKPGYSEWTGTVRLKSNETYTLAVALEPISVETGNSLTASGEQLYRSGQALMSEGKIDEAIRDLTEAISIQPSLADAYFTRAEAYVAGGKSKLAEDDFIRAGEIYAAQRRSESALTAFNRAIGINKKSAAAYIDRGDLYRQMDIKQSAVEDFRTALKCDENSFRANFELGKMYFALGNNGDADKRLRKAQELDPRSPEVYHYLMLNYLARDDFGKVKKAYTAFKVNVSQDDLQTFKDDPKFDAVLRVIGEYEQP